MKALKKQIFMALAFLPVALFAQNDRDAFKFSFMTPTGTARFSSLSGSMGAFGADFSTASTNPAALGTYNKSEFTFSPSLYRAKSEISYNGETADDYKWNFNFGNIGLVLALPNVGGKWKAVQFSTGINRTGSFHLYSYATGPNNGNTSITDNFTDPFSVSGNNVSGSYSSYAAYNLYLTDTFAGGFQSSISNKNLMQEKSTSVKGAMNEYVISVSGNYDDVLFLGATLGIPYFSYKESSTYAEYNMANNEAFHNLQYGDELTQNGTGINFKFGMLYQPFNFIRLGFAIHSPTFYDIDEYYNTNLAATHDSVGYKEYLIANGDFNYRLVTPYHVLGDVAFMFRTFGFINFGYEYTDYKAMRLRADTYSFRKENNDISNLYQGVHTFKVGGELNLAPLALRAGYSHSTNPFVEQGKDGSVNQFSAGLGFRSQFYYVDFAFVHQSYKESDIFYQHCPYVYENSISKNHFIATLGWKF